MINHKIFKTLIDQTTFSNFIKYLFVRNVMTQSLKFEFANVWKHIHFELIEILNFVNSKYSTFVKKFLFLNNRIFEKNDEIRSHHIWNDFNYHFIQFSLFDIVTKFNALKLKTRVNLIKFFFQHSFFSKFHKCLFERIQHTNH